MESMEFHGFHGIQSTVQSTVQCTVLYIYIYISIYLYIYGALCGPRILIYGALWGLRVPGLMDPGPRVRASGSRDSESQDLMSRDLESQTKGEPTREGLRDGFLIPRGFLI